MANKKRMKKSTYLIVWSLVFALILGATGIANGVALYWDSALSLYFGEVGGQQSAEGQTGDSIYFPSDYANSDARLEGDKNVAYRIASEGAVLLKNDNAALPMAGGKISLFGIDAKSGNLQRRWRPTASP